MTTRRTLLKSALLPLYDFAGRPKTVVAVLLRGGVDGLSMVVPHGDPHYYAQRPGIAIPRPGRGAGAAIDLDGNFGLHPALAPLKPLFDEQRLAVVHAAGSPRPTRSHFDAQDYMESGIPGRASGDGWLNRTLTLRGGNTAVARPEPPPAAADPASHFGRSLSEIARSIKTGAGPEAAFAAMDGWDTHAHQSDALAGLFSDFALSLAAFHRDLGRRTEDVVVVAMSEFGRSVRENEDRGTDHGHGGVMLVLGGNIHGGKVYGEWPGLAPAQLHEGRDLAVTTDFRDVLGEVVARHCGVRDMVRVFPGYSPRFRGLFG